MRRTNTTNGLTVQVISGTYVVLIGINLPKDKCPGLLGFAIHRTDHIEDEAYYIKGMKTFKETDPGFLPGSTYSSRYQPFQTFTWGDYSAKPGYKYTYRVEALYGTPKELESRYRTSVTINTENPIETTHDIYFNRGIAASQEYARRFGDRRPEDVGPPAFKWLSRGIYEGLERFITPSNPKRYSFRICAYEFHYAPFLKLLSQAVRSGSDLKIIYDRKDEPEVSSNGSPNTSKRNEDEITRAGLRSRAIPRREYKSAISHNKFIVRLRNNKPEAVWTGGMNFSEGGIFGHSNVAHVVEDPKVAQQYLDYWNTLSKDPTGADLRPKVTEMFDVPSGLPKKGTSAVFSPRYSTDALNWYADLALNAKESVFATFAFGMNDVFQNVYENSSAGLRFALMERLTRPMKRGPKRTAAEKRIKELRYMPENLFAVGSFLKEGKIDHWLAERLSGLNTYVKYVHNKFLLIDPLSNDPIVITGSANFSEASSIKNDENMLVIRGNKRVADVYLGEFMRLYSHHAFREWAARNPRTNRALKNLSTGDWWKPYFKVSIKSRQRDFFSGVSSK